MCDPNIYRPMCDFGSPTKIESISRMADPRRTEQNPFYLLHHWVYNHAFFFYFDSNVCNVYLKIVIKNCHFVIYVNYLKNKYT